MAEKEQAPFYYEKIITFLSQCLPVVYFNPFMLVAFIYKEDFE